MKQSHRLVLSFPRKAGIQGSKGVAVPRTPAFEGVTIHLVRTGFILSHTRKGECMKLYTYYRSQASFRVRIALNLKGSIAVWSHDAVGGSAVLRHTATGRTFRYGELAGDAAKITLAKEKRLSASRCRV